jgi:cerevisin
VAKNVNLVAVKILNKDGVGAISDIIEGIDWMVDDFKEKEKSSKKKRGKAVANLSLGAKGVSVAMEKAILQAVDAGVNFVVAAGNDFDDACKFTPAYVPQAITVGAMGIEDITSPFSNYGVCVDIFAPGESILSAYPGAPDASAIQQGTSMASPHVAGAVARVLSRYDEPPPPLDVHDLMVEASTKDALVAKTPDTPNRLLYLTCGGVSTLVNGGAAVIGVMNLFTALSVMSSLLVVMDCRL